jgi:hypothetical protein
MKVQLEFNANELAVDFIDSFVCARLKEQRDMIADWKGYRHKDDSKQHKRIVKAIDALLEYYGAT